MFYIKKYFQYILYKLTQINQYKFGDWGLGIGDWGLGIGD